MWLACLPGHCLTLLALYINCSYFTCRSLVHILNKILLFAPPLASDTSQPNLCKGCKTTSKTSPICRLVITHAIAITLQQSHDSLTLL